MLYSTLRLRGSLAGLGQQPAAEKGGLRETSRVFDEVHELREASRELDVVHGLRESSWQLEKVQDAPRGHIGHSWR